MKSPLSRAFFYLWYSYGERAESARYVGSGVHERCWPPCCSDKMRPERADIAHRDEIVYHRRTICTIRAL